MVERFRLITIDDETFIADNGEHIILDDVVDTLNEQNELIKQLVELLAQKGVRIVFEG